LPLLVSVPHDGREVPPGIAARMTDAGRALPDTDWHVAQLYDPCRALGAHLLIARQSRYVVDLNRPPDDGALYPGQLSTGICPTQTFSGESIYQGGAAVGPDEQATRVERHWKPYHRQLKATLHAIHARHGYALLWDAHSIPSVVPRLFEGELPVLNLGTDGGRACTDAVFNAVAEIAQASPYSCALNGRFRGGYITRHYGRPADQRFAIQLEMAQRAYMSKGAYDDGRAAAVWPYVSRMLETFMKAARANG
ncbi:MAG: N-formylglutamate deformylase, partial [Myxococcota bacterium]